MKKKLLSLIMAVAMIASLALPAFASTANVVQTPDSNGVYSGGTTMGSQTRVAVVKVTLPLATNNANKVILNPYELKLFTSTSSNTAANSGNQVLADDNAVADADGVASPQVITVPLEIKSESDVPLTVGLTAKATVGGETKLTATDVDQSAVDTDKNLFLYVDMLRTTDGSAVSDWTADTAPTWRDDSSKVNTDAFSQVIPTAQGAKRENIISIPEGTAGKYVYFKIMGSAAPSPKKNWTSSDTVSVELAFTFAPTKTYAVTAKKPSGATFANAAASDYVVGFGGETSATPGSSVVLKAGNNKIFSDVLIIKAPDAANGITEADEVTAATAVKVTDDTYYFVMPAEPVYIHASVETAS